MIDIYKDLEDMNLMVVQQGSVVGEYPDSYITIWNDYSINDIDADDTTMSIEYKFTVIYYTKDWETIYSVFENIVSLLKSKNYIVDGMGFDIDSGDDDYMARCIEVIKIERRN